MVRQAPFDKLKAAQCIAGDWGMTSETFSQFSLPTIRIRTEIQDANRVLIRIADNGLGMSEYPQSFFMSDRSYPLHLVFTLQ